MTIKLPMSNIVYEANARIQEELKSEEEFPGNKFLSFLISHQNQMKPYF